MSGLSDIICAPITGPMRAPVAIIRVSGTRSWEIAKKVFAPLPDTVKPRHAYYGEVLAGGRKFDDGMLVLFEEGQSYTEEESFEISCHGSPQIVRTLMEEIVSRGARIARPGEFTERAFLNGRIDLTQAEAIREAIESATDAQARRANLLREGRLAKTVGEIEDEIGRVLALAEATVDFSEEIGELDRDSTVDAIVRVIQRIDGLLARKHSARLIREGMRIALVGRPNVGKSSLMNALLGLDRAIVTAVPGTTRDTIEETVSIRGLPVVLTDTAGLRATDDPVEKIGVERSRKAIETADEVWFVFEAHRGVTEEDRQLLAEIGRGVLMVGNKADLGTMGAGAIEVSAITGMGIENLEGHVMEAFDSGNELPLTNERHHADLDEAKISLQHAAETLTGDLPTDLACVDLRGAIQAIGRITGTTATDEVLDRVFRDFCVGK
ncbi:MAG: tRNA uridine-5-carboxymethylaminomethyl(34) synthesis GTPase MnmE [Fimbriimonadales bacterium]|nr:tRNA uridine-5-carboxymethylaminomethyl(34) synthesis GTPase MnmE [Fimbriimonadales bacterium]